MVVFGSVIATNNVLIYTKSHIVAVFNPQDVFMLVFEDNKLYIPYRILNIRPVFVRVITRPKDSAQRTRTPCTKIIFVCFRSRGFPLSQRDAATVLIVPGYVAYLP